MTEPEPLAEVMAGDVSADAGGSEGEDVGRVDPAAHRGHDVGILSRLFVLLRERRDDDPTGPRPLPPEGSRR